MLAPPTSFDNKNAAMELVCQPHAIFQADAAGGAVRGLTEQGAALRDTFGGRR
jgi:hypothetical protein